MSIFQRRFEVGKLASWDNAHPGNAVRALFDRWALPGEPGSAARPLRVGIRDGYLNLYMKGQSVAKLSMKDGEPTVTVHEAYLAGPKGERGDRVAQRYRTIDATDLARAETAAILDTCIANALSYASAEKRFVDDLIGRNPGVLDLEMGLPAGDAPAGERVAPRMDLVVAQIADGTARVAFWEAKCADNPELRARGDAAPKVLGQLERYRRWMTPGNVAAVAAAYRETAGTLRGLQLLFRSDATGACLAVWRAVKEAEPEVIVPPGVVIGNYATIDGTADRIARSAASFADNGHRAKLTAAGVTVHEVAADAQDMLPTLVA